MELSYEVTGSGRHAIILTHGLAASAALWHEQVRGLSAEFRVLTWDLRGHGQSAPAAGPFTLSDLGKDLRRVLDQAGIERAVVLCKGDTIEASHFPFSGPAPVAASMTLASAEAAHIRKILSTLGFNVAQAARALDSVAERLATSHGVLLLQPALDALVQWTLRDAPRR